MAELNSNRDTNYAQRLKRLNSLQYDILLRQKKDRFYLYIPEISLVGVGEDLNQAYEDLCKKKQDLFNRILDCQAEDEINLPRKLHWRGQIFYQLKIFTIKVLIICFLMGSTFIFGAAVLKDKIANISGGEIVKQITKGITLEAAKFTNTPEEIKQIRIKKFREFLEDFRPWVNEFKNVFLSPTPSGEPKDDEGGKQ